MKWVLLLLATGGLSAAAGLVIANANRDRRWSWWRLPPARPALYYVTYVATLLLGFTTATRGGDAVGDRMWIWTLAAMALPLLAVQIAHNRGVARTTTGPH